MKIIPLIMLLLVNSLCVFAQNVKHVVIYKQPKKVPEGKVWKIERGQQVKIQVSDGTLSSGSYCNAMFLSNPGIIFNINRGDYYNAEGYGIIISSFEKVPYTNDRTFLITPLSIIDKDFDISQFRNLEPKDIGTKEIVFKAGETVFAGSCFESIEVIESDLSKEDLLAEKKKKDLAIKLRMDRKSNFNIPIDPEKRVDHGTKPELHDKGFSSISFSSNAVLVKRPGKGYSVDTVSKWEMNLSIDELTINSSNGIAKTYKVLGIKYDEDLRMQEFSLGDETGATTHTFDVAWSNSRKYYSVILSSTDNLEEYQFQETKGAVNK
jgi:hypothetical protein